MRKILTILFIFLGFCSFAQKINYSISLSYNQPFIASIEETSGITTTFPASTGYISFTNDGHLKESYTSKSGGRVSGNISYSINSKLFIESGFQLNLIRYQKSTEVVMDDIENYIIPGVYVDSETGEIITGYIGGFIVGETYGGLIGTLDGNDNLLINSEIIYNIDDNKLGNTACLYTEIPIKFGYSFFQNKLKLKLGIIASFLSYNSVYKADYGYYSNEVIKDKTADGFSNVMWNSTVELEYIFGRNWGIDMNYSHSLNSIYDKDASIGKPKFNIFSLGLSYYFSRKI